MEEEPSLLLSIIVPVYNVEKYIRPCMESIFRQKYLTLMIKRMPHVFINLYYQYAKIAFKIKQ